MSQYSWTSRGWQIKRLAEGTFVSYANKLAATGTDVKLFELSFNDFAERFWGAPRRETPLSQSLLSINEKRVSLTRGRRLVSPGETQKRATLNFSHFFLYPSLYFSSRQLSLLASFSPSFVKSIDIRRTCRKSRVANQWLPMNWFLYCTNFYDLYSSRRRSTRQPILSSIPKKLILMSWRDGGKFGRTCIDPLLLLDWSSLRS